MYSFPYLEPVCCSMSSSNCCFLTYILISQEAGRWSDLPISFKNFPQFVVIHTVKDFGIVNTAEVDVFWNSFVPIRAVGTNKSVMWDLNRFGIKLSELYKCLGKECVRWRKTT